MKYVAYYRLSKEKIDKNGKKVYTDGLGIKAQRSIVSHFFDEDEIISEFTEVKSAKNIIDRPQLQKALELCVKEEATLVIAKMDRMSRQMLDFETIHDMLDGRIHSCDVSSKGSPTPKEYFQMKMIFAEKERELISIRTKEGLAQSKKKKGNPKVKERVEEYRGYVSRARQTVIENSRNNPANVRATALIIKAKREGKTYAKIADELNSAKFKTRNGCSFSATSVMRLYQRQIN